MNHHHRLALLLFGAVLLVASPAAAQFETPNRQFHDKTTFRLEGRHLDVACASCHIKDVYKGTPNKCFDCHWERRQDDRFRLQLGTQCEQSHRPVAWTAVRFDHGAFTGMRLNGAHGQLSCQSCHRNDNLRTAQSTCVSCHLADYQAAREPNHVAGGFPTTCDTCHRTSDTSFSQGSFNHQATFPLVGQHAQQSCAACHKNNVYVGTPRDCVGCHRDAYNRTSSPPHAAAGFSTTCESCHRATDSSFRGAGFNHAVVFPLVGQHASRACSACHANNVYRGTPRECVACHRTAYERTTAPAHTAAGFGTTCETCHQAGDSTWRLGRFNHRFPITGRHNAPCSTCHQSGAAYQNFTCLTCHEHSQSSMDREHRGKSGYRYESRACYSCHPQGRE
jgi:hypothetical protein